MVDPLDARPRDRYLARVAAELRLSDEVSREVIEELAAHIADATTDLEAEGLTSEQAERESLARLGSPDALAQDIGRAHRTTRRLLAAAGGGLIAAGGGALRGWFIGIFAILGIFYLVVLAGLVLSQVLHVQIDVGAQDRGWNSAVTILAVAAALWGAIQAGLATLARRSRHPVRSLQPIVAGIGVALGLLAIAGWRIEQNWASVLAMLALPFVAVVASIRVRETSRARRVTWRSLGVAAIVLLPLVVVLLALYGAAGTSGGGSGRQWPSLEAMWHDTGWDRVGLPVAGDEPIFIETTIRTTDGLFTLDIERPASLAGWHDLRLELWQASPASSDTGPKPEMLRSAVPVATADGRLVASARIDDLPGVTSVYGVLTGMAPNGGRYVLAEEYSQTSFRGTVLDWFAAIGR